MTALIPETFHEQIFRLYLSPFAFNFSQSYTILSKSVSVLFIMGFFSSVFAFLDAGSTTFSGTSSSDDSALLVFLAAAFEVLFAFVEAACYKFINLIALSN